MRATDLRAQSGEFKHERRLLVEHNANSEACVVWAKNADVAKVEALFKAALDKFKNPDKKVYTTSDKMEPSPHGKVHVLKCHSETSNGMVGVFSAVIAEQAGGPFQVMLEAIGGQSK